MVEEDNTAVETCSQVLNPIINNIRVIGAKTIKEIKVPISHRVIECFHKVRMLSALQGVGVCLQQLDISPRAVRRFDSSSAK